MWLQCIVFWGGERADENATVDENAKRSQAGALCEPAAAPANARPAPCPRRCLLRPPKTFQDTKALQDHVQERHPKTQLSRARVAVCNLISTSRLALEQKKNLEHNFLANRCNRVLAKSISSELGRSRRFSLRRHLLFSFTFQLHSSLRG